MTAPETLAIDGTGVALDGRAVVLTGPSESGKSDLALRLIDSGAALIADDRLELLVCEGVLCCRAPADMPVELRGRIEVRGVGIMPVPATADTVPVAWFVELVAPVEVERLPRAENRTVLGCQVPLLRLAPFEASAVAKLRLAAGVGPGLIMGRE
ncbi:MAG TPA: hypothetical protein VMT54_05850 [Candidatus Cybelea sp.]|nr:hypothetical protein [Candidatus Cybelea sp.]